MDLVHLHTALPAGDPVPPRVHLVPAGTFSGVDGRGPYHLASTEALIRDSMARGKLVLDENHSTDHAMRSGGSAPAVAWITELHSEADGIWGSVEWNATGRALLENRAYRGISPAMVVRDGEVIRIVRASLTNTPNLDVTHLHNQEPTMDLARVRTLLGLADTATETDVERVLVAARGSTELHSQVEAIAGVTAKSTGELVTALRAKVATVSANDGRVVELQSQIERMIADGKRRDAEAVVDGAIRDGRAISETLRTDLISLHATNPDAVKRMIESVPNLKRAPLSGSTALTPPGTELAGQVGALLGIDPAKIVAAAGSAA